MQKLTVVLFAGVVLWQTTLTASNKRMIDGRTQGDWAGQALVTITTISTVGILLSPKRNSQ